MPGPYRLSYEGQNHLLETESNVPYVYDDKRKKGDPYLARYEDARGYPTIGLGIRIDTQEERDLFRPYLNGKAAPSDLIAQWNAKVIAQFEYDLNRKLGVAELNPNQFDALFSLAWNTGVNSDSVEATIAAVKRGDYEAARNAIANGPVTSKGEVLQGLVARRKREAELFAKPYDWGTTNEPGWEPPVVQEEPTWAWYKNPNLWAHATVVTICLGLLFRHYRTHRKFQKHQSDWDKLKKKHDKGRKKDAKYLVGLGENELYPSLQTNPRPRPLTPKKPSKSAQPALKTKTRKPTK